MKRILLTLAILALPSLAVAQPSLIGTVAADGKTTATSAANPVPILGSVTVSGSVTTTDQKGAGATTATTLRTVTATNSPDVTALGTIAASTGALSAAAPTSAQLLGLTDSVTGLLMPARAYDADTGAGFDYRLGTVPLLAGAGGGTPASAGAGNVDAGTQRMTLGATDPAVVSLGTIDDLVKTDRSDATKGVQILAWNSSAGGYDAIFGGAGSADGHSLRTVPASIPYSAPLAIVEVTAAEVEVLPAMAGRRAWGVQVFADVDGPICCSLGATTTACANPAFMLDPSPAAARAGGSKEDSGYSGAVTCRAMGDYRVSVSRWQY